MSQGTVMDHSDDKQSGQTGSYPVVSAGSPLEQFLLLAKSAKGAAAGALVMQVVAAPSVYVFQELLSCPNIAQLKENPETVKFWDLLNLFAFGSFEEFQENRSKFPQLSEPMLLKLRQLTLASIAATNRRISYEWLQQILHVANVRELEDLVIDAVYKGIIRGKLDQQNQCLQVEQCMGRDVKPEELGGMIRTLSDWCSQCQATLIDLEDQIRKVDERKQEAMAEQKKIEEEYTNMKKSLKTAQGGSGTPDLDDGIPGEVTSTRGSEPQPKKEKTRHHKGGLRGSSARMFSKGQSHQ